MTGGAFKTLFLCLIVAAGLIIPASGQDLNVIQGRTAPSDEPPMLRFRHADLGGKPASFVRDTVIVLADEDFPPFSYAGPEGEPKGIAVDAALAACQELRTKCQIVLTSWTALSGDLDGVSWELLSTTGEAGAELVRIAEERDAACVVVGKRHKGFSEFLHRISSGSVSRAIVARQKFPVMVVP